MIYNKLLFYNFRNIQNCTVELKSKYILLIGENAQGKTNLLEAIYLLSYGRSFRTNNFDEITTFQKDECSLNAVLFDLDQLKHSIGIQYKNNQKQIILNGNTVADRKQLLHHNPTIIFSYEDYQIITEGHERRRTFFDQVQCFISIQYVDLMRNYRRVLRQRNQALKERNTAVLDVYNYQLAKYGLDIMEQRQQCVERCSQYANKLFSDMLSDDQSLIFSYCPSWHEEGVEKIVQYLERRMTRDLRVGYSSSGPHRDKILFFINGKDATTYASTGQIRSIALVVKMVQSMIIFDVLNKKPVLLFDDVLLELDTRREQGILQQLPDTSQLFFTFLPHKESDLLHLTDTQKIFVKNGTLLSD